MANPNCPSPCEPASSSQFLNTVPNNHRNFCSKMETTVSLFWDLRRSTKERGRDGSLAAARTVVVKLVGAGGTLLHGLTRTTGNRDRIRRTVGERNVSRIFPSRSADPVPPWRQTLLHLPLLPSLRRGSNRFSLLLAPASSRCRDLVRSRGQVVERKNPRY